MTPENERPWDVIRAAGESKHPWWELTEEERRLRSVAPVSDRGTQVTRIAAILALEPVGFALHAYQHTLVEQAAALYDAGLRADHLDAPVCHRHGGWHHHAGFEHSDGRQHPRGDHEHR